MILRGMLRQGVREYRAERRQRAPGVVVLDVDVPCERCDAPAGSRCRRRGRQAHYHHARGRLAATVRRRVNA